MLNEITIKYFKSIGSGGVRIGEISSLTTFVGQNNSGKSAVLESLYVLLLAFDTSNMTNDFVQRGATSLSISGTNMEKIFPKINEEPFIFKNKNYSSNPIIELRRHFADDDSTTSLEEMKKEIISHFGEPKTRKFFEDGFDLRIRYSVEKRGDQLIYMLQEIIVNDLKWISRTGPKEFSCIVLRDYINDPTIPKDRLKYINNSQPRIQYLAASFHMLLVDMFNNNRPLYLPSARRINAYSSVDEVVQSPENLKKHLFDLYFSKIKSDNDLFKAISEEFFTISNYEIAPPVFNTSTGQIDIAILQGKDNAFKIDIENVGYGIYQLLYILYVLKKEDRRVLIIDEPEISLQPKMQLKLKNYLKNLKDKTIFIASHSPYFVDIESVKSTYKAFLTDNKKATQILALDDNNDRKFIKKIYDFKELFFLDRVVFVEGFNDYRLFTEILPEIQPYMLVTSGNTGKVWSDKVFDLCSQLGVVPLFIKDIDVYDDFWKKMNALIRKVISERKLNLTVPRTKNEKKDFLIRFWTNYESEYQLAKRLLEDKKEDKVEFAPWIDVSADYMQTYNKHKKSLEPLKARLVEFIGL